MQTIVKDAEYVRSLIAEYGDHHHYELENELNAEERWMAEQTRVLLIVTIDNPSRNYFGPKMFSMKLMPSRIIDLLRVFIQSYGHYETHFYAGKDYEPLLSQYEINSINNPSLIGSFTKLSSFIPTESIDLISMLPGFIIEAYCKSLGIDPEDVMPYDEIMEARWSEVLGILEDAVDKRLEP